MLTYASLICNDIDGYLWHVMTKIVVSSWLQPPADPSDAPRSARPAAWLAAAPTARAARRPDLRARWTRENSGEHGESMGNP